MKTGFKLLSAILILTFAAACSGSRNAQPESAEKLLSTAERQMERGLWEDAAASWEKVRDSYYSPELSMLAELKIAETYFLAERYAEAATTYDLFLQRYPNDVRTPTILFRIGQSYYQQILSPDRDQTATRNALAAFEDFLRRFPDDPKAEEAKQQALRARTRLADHEVYVGRFYLQRKHYLPAIKRLETILTQFPDYYYRDEAYFFLGQAYLKNGQTEQAHEILQQLTEQFPGSTYYARARKLLPDQG